MRSVLHAPPSHALRVARALRVQVIWDPRLPHTTGEPDGLSGGAHPRQVLYCAFMLLRGNEALAAEQRECRESGRHMRWAPSAQRDDEVRGYAGAAPLGPLGAQLYGYHTAQALSLIHI